MLGDTRVKLHVERGVSDRVSAGIASFAFGSRPKPLGAVLAGDAAFRAKRMIYDAAR